jgi:hypothetical protein
MLSRLPLAFVENQGQWDTPAKFVARRGGMVARIEPDALVLQLTRRYDADRIEGVVVRLVFEGGLGRREGRTSPSRRDPIRGPAPRLHG